MGSPALFAALHLHNSELGLGYTDGCTNRNPACRCRHLLVVDEANRAHGMITRRDLAHAAGSLLRCGGPADGQQPHACRPACCVSSPCRMVLPAQPSPAQQPSNLLPATGPGCRERSIVQQAAVLLDPDMERPLNSG